MEVKFNRRLDDYNYILSFDLAKHKTGYALIDFKSKKIEKYGLIVTDKENIMPWDYFYSKLREIIEEIRVKTNGNNFFVIKERLPNQNGPRSSIAALQELAKAHAVFDLFVAQNGIDYYDYIGIHSVSVKSYYKTQYGIEKPQTDAEYALKAMRMAFKIEDYSRKEELRMNKNHKFLVTSL